MGLLNGSVRSAESPLIENETLELDDCNQLIGAVGEAHYQPVLIEICASPHWERVRFDCMAALAPEPDNPYDPNAVRVMVEHRGTATVVAYLSRDDAVAYRRALGKATAMGFTIVCQAHIAGREEGSETHHLGVFLDLPTPRSCLRQLAEPLD